jgi:hypothetical protein
MKTLVGGKLIYKDESTGIPQQTCNMPHEGLRKDTMDKHLPHRKTECVELADAFIRMMDYIGEFHPDFGEAVVEKLVYNRSRKDHTTEARLAPGGKKF